MPPKNLSAGHRNLPFMFAAHAKWASLKGMAKLRSARPKKAGTPPVRGGLPCVIFVILAVILVMVFLYLVMSHAG
jgi:hypothetical protein